MVKYIYLAISLIFVCAFCYFFLANRLNRRLNIKKKQIAVSPIKNKYTKLMFISCIFSFIFGMMFVLKIINRDYNELKEINGAIEYYDNYKNYNLVDYSVSNPIKYKVINQTLEDQDNVYYYENNYIYKYQISTSKITKETISSDYNIISLYQNNDYVALLSNASNKTRIDIINKNDFKIKNTIISDGICDFFTIDNQEINFVLTNEAKKDSYKNGYFQNKSQKVLFDKMIYIDCTSFNKILTHLKITLKDFKVYNQSICIANGFMAISDDIYIAFDSFNDGKALNKLYVLKYSIKDMNVNNYKTLNGVIYSSPYFVDNRLHLVLDDLESNQKRIVKMDKYLNVLGYSTIDLLNKPKDNVIVYNNNYLNIENVAYFNNNYLIGYSISEQFLYVTAVNFDLFVSHEYRFVIESNYQSFDLINCFIQNNTLVISYKCDELYGYNYLNIITDKYDILQPNSDKEYFVTINNIINDNKLKGK